MLQPNESETELAAIGTLVSTLHAHVGAGTALLKDPGGCTKEKAFQLGVSNWVRQKAVRP